MRKYNKKIQNSETQKPKKFKLFFIILIFILLGFLAFLIFKVLTLDKFIFVNRTKAGDAEIISDNFRYKILADTVLESARGYGKYKISSLWILSKKDENKGKIVAESIAKNYSIPVYLWKDSNNTNLNLYQRIKVFFIEKENENRDLVFTSFVLPKSILINFTNPLFVESVPKINIEDLTGNSKTIDKVSRLIETIGGKITSNSKGYDENLDCELYGSDLQILEIFSNTLTCKYINQTNNEDVGIRLGGKFAERF